jgi:TatD DNase family protein
MLFNTHSHVDTSRQFATDRDEVVERARQAGVTRLTVIGFNREAAVRTVAFIDRYPWAYAAVGIHPTDALEWNEQVCAEVEAHCRHPRVVAVGEVGLDYYWKDRAPFDLQRDVFRAQIRLARARNLPLVIHCRDAYEDTVSILEQQGAAAVGGVMHCFSADLAMAERCLALGFYLGFGGTLTYKNNPVGQAVARAVPLDRIVLETDDPYLAPMPHRGKRNEPGYVRLVAEFLADLRGCSVEEVAAATYENGSRLFRLN